MPSNCPNRVGSKSLHGITNRCASLFAMGRDKFTGNFQGMIEGQTQKASAIGTQLKFLLGYGKRSYNKVVSELTGDRIVELTNWNRQGRRFKRLVKAKTLESRTKILRANGFSEEQAQDIATKVLSWGRNVVDYYSGRYFENNALADGMIKSKLGVREAAIEMYKNGYRSDEKYRNINDEEVESVKRQKRVTYIQEEIRQWMDGGLQPNKEQKGHLAKILNMKPDELFYDLPPSWLAKKLGISENHQWIKWQKEGRDLRNKISEALANNSQISGAARQAILDNLGYVKRIYAKHVLQKHFQVDPGAFDVAKEEVTEHIKMQIAKFVNYINKGDSTPEADERRVAILRYALDGDAETFREVTLFGKNAMENATAARHLYVPISDVFDKVFERDTIDTQTGRIADAIENIENMSDVAEKYMSDVAERLINQYMEPGKYTGPMVNQHSIPIEHLMSRYLSSPAFRSLYGEVLNPVVRTAYTIQAQATLFANMSLVDSIREQKHKGVYWSVLRNDEKGFTEQIPDVPGRWGDLAGRYTTKDISNWLLMPPLNKYYRVFLRSLGAVRLGKLWRGSTIARNFLTSYTGMAMGCGDLLDPRYLAEHVRAVKVWRRSKVTDNDKVSLPAQDKIVEWTRMGVLDPRHNSFSADTFNLTMQYEGATDALVSITKGMSVDKILKEAWKIYAFMDVPAKIASYEYNKKRFIKKFKLSNEDAALAASEFVKQHYQYAPRVSRIAGKISRSGLDDFLTFKFDSMRIWYNSAEYAMNSALGRGKFTFTKNNETVTLDFKGKQSFRPMVGFAIANSMLLHGFFNTAAGILSKWDLIKEWLKGHDDGDDDDDDKVSFDREIPINELNDIRELLPNYYASALLFGWRRKDGRPQIVVMDYMNFFPHMSALAAMIQARSPKYMLKQLLTDTFGVGIVPAALIRFMFGKDPTGFRETEKGFVDAMGNPLEETDTMKKRLLEFGKEVNPVSALSKDLSLYVYQKQLETSESPKAKKMSRTSDMILFDSFSPVRIYTVRPSASFRSKMYNLKDSYAMLRRDINKLRKDREELKGGPREEVEEKIFLLYPELEEKAMKMIRTIETAKRAFPQYDASGELHKDLDDVLGSKDLSAKFYWATEFDKKYGKHWGTLRAMRQVFEKYDDDLNTKYREELR